MGAVKMKEKNYIIEFLRFFFTIGVVVGHAYCVFYQENNPSYTIQFHTACVDFFFIISGFFTAKHFYKNEESSNEKKFLKYNLSRIKRLYPLLVIGALEGIVYDGIRLRFQSESWPTFFFLGGINKFAGWNVIWYISALFWGTLVASALLCWRKKLAVSLYFPLIAFFSLSIMNYWGCCNLFSVPLIGNFFSAGLVRGMCGISFGIEAYYLSIFIGKNLDKFKNCAVAFLSIMFEIAFIILVVYLAVKQHFNDKEFLMYFATAALLVVLNLNQQRIFSCLNLKIWDGFGKISAMIYVTHFYIEKGFYKISCIRDLPDIAVYGICVVSACVAGFIAFKAEKQAEKIFSKLIFK